MQAAVFKALGKPLSVEQVADPVPGPKEVLIKPSIWSGRAAPSWSMVTETMALSALPEAFEALRRRTTQCKTLVDTWES